MPKLMIPRREAWLDMPEEYAGFRVQVWLNAPARVWNGIWAGDGAETEAGLRQVIVAHNDWCDFDGNPYPQPSESEFWQEIPTELAAIILRVAREATYDLPNSLPPKRRTSANGSRPATAKA